MFMALTNSLVVHFIAVLLQIFLGNFYSNASCFPLLWLYLGNSQVSVYRTIGSTLVIPLSRSSQYLEHWQNVNIDSMCIYK